MDLSLGPRVLVVNGEPFNRSSATGITMSNLFLEWPQERLGQVFTANMATERRATGCNIQLSSRDLFPFSHFRASAASAEAHGAPSELKGNDFATSGREMVRAYTRKLVSPLLEFLPYNIPTEAMGRIASFQPDVIYSMLGSIRMVALVSTLSKRLNIPVVPHFMDDWISTYSVPGRSVGSPLHARYLQSAVKELFGSVPVAMSIGEMMSEEYSKRFSRGFFDFMNPVVVDDDFPRATLRNADDVVRFVYVGGLHLGRADCLVDIAEAVHEVAAAGRLIELHIYAPETDAIAAKALQAISPSVLYRGSIPQNQVRSVLDQSDVAVHVESFDDRCAEYTRLSVSTKIPQYMAAGIPLLAYGPASLASCRYVQSTGSGVLVGARDKSAIRDAVESLVSSEQFRSELGLCGWQQAREFHDGRVVRKRFRDVLSSAASAGNSGALHE